MFEAKTPTPAPATGGQPAAPKPEAAVADFVIHSMPKEFYDRPINLYPHDKPQPLTPPTASKPPIPTTSLPPQVGIPVQAPAKPGVLLPLNRGPVVMKPKVVVPSPPKKRKKTWLLVLVSLLLIGGSVFGILAYTQGWFSKVPEVVDIPIDLPGDQEPEVIVPEPEPPKVTTGADTDSDGLTNVEELLYGTDFRNPDSDGDTYLDGNEVFHRYNPVALAPSTLLDTGAVRVLESPDLPFSMSYPTSWNPISQPAVARVSFRSDTGAVVSILWQTKAEDVGLSDWYLAQVGEVSLDRLQPTTTKEGYSALIGPDERVMYLEANGSAYTLVYELGDSQSVEFLQTFKMMANSFRLTN